MITPTKGRKYIYGGLELLYIGKSNDGYVFIDQLDHTHTLYNLDGIEELKPDLYSAIREIKGVLSDFSDEEQLEIISTINVLASEIRDKKPIYYASSNLQ